LGASTSIARKAALLSNNIIGRKCHSFFYLRHGLFRTFAVICLFILPLFSDCFAQTIPDPLPDVSEEVLPRLRVDRSLGASEVLVLAKDKRIEGDWTYLEGMAELRANAVLLRADEIDYNQQTGYAEARGNVYYEDLQRKEKVWATRAEYFTREERGKFYQVRGETYPKIEGRPGLYRTESPVRFEGAWAERLGEEFRLYDGTLTNCETPLPWWTLKSPQFSIRPGESATMRNAVLRIRKVPVLYAPWFYKSLKEGERKSGFLTPNIGNSNRRGQMVGVGYYWAIARNYDAMYRGQYFTTRGLAHQVDFRGKPTRNSDFNFSLYGVNDRGLPIERTVLVPNPERPGELIQVTRADRFKASGVNITSRGQTTLPKGFYARGELNYLSSLRFRQEFSESIAEAIAPEIQSVGVVARDWSTFHLTAVFSRLQNFRTTDEDVISVRKLPELRLASRSRRLRKEIPVYVAFDAAGGLVRRSQPLFQTRQFVSRVDFAPRIFAPLEWKGFHIVPSYSPRVTAYDSKLEGAAVGGVNVVGANLLRRSQEFGLEILPPSLSRVFNKKGIWGDKVKHVIEPRLALRYVNGIDNFNELVRFDTTELLSNTAEAEFSLVNRFFGKRGDSTDEVLTWEVRHKRFFDSDFGGAVVAGRRNVVASSLDFSTFTFLNQPRTYSPIASTFRISPATRYGIQWRSDFDPFYNQFLNSILSVDARVSDFLFVVGQNRVRSTPLLVDPDNPNETLARDIPSSQLLSPPANQLISTVAWRDSLKRGWSAAFNNWYDFRTRTVVTSTGQLTYNTDCCGFSVQYRRFGFGTRSENQFRFSLTIANIGAFGTLRKQERLF
jgi:LPS-assembly protein